MEAELLASWGAPGKLLDSFDLAGVAKRIKDGKALRIVCLCGAGISVAAGIPDFRTAGKGIFSNLGIYDLPEPESIFTISYFRNHPEPFHQLLQELFPGTHRPTLTHYFITLLHKKGLLLRCFTQNIDSLETLAGLPHDKLVAAHGNFDGATCIKCHKKHSLQYVKETIFSDKPLKQRICRCLHVGCNGLVKPNITFYGEPVSRHFHEAQLRDMPKCDLLIVMGTSLIVEPFRDLLCKVSSSIPRLLINREPVGLAKAAPAGLRQSPRISRPFQFNQATNYRDAVWLGDCDNGIRDLCEHLGWKEELEQLMREGHAALAEGQEAAPGAQGMAEAGELEAVNEGAEAAVPADGVPVTTDVSASELNDEHAAGSAQPAGPAEQPPAAEESGAAEAEGKTEPGAAERKIEAGAADVADGDVRNNKHLPDLKQEEATATEGAVTAAESAALADAAAPDKGPVEAAENGGVHGAGARSSSNKRKAKGRSSGSGKRVR